MVKTKEEIIKKLSCNFEPELAKEIAEFNIVEFDPNTVIGDNSDNLQILPLVLEGSIKVVRYDHNKNEIIIYRIQKIQTCILSVTAAMLDNFDKKTIAITEEKTSVIAIAPDKADEWMVKYASWRNFIVNLYQTRLNELLLQHSQISKQKDNIEKQKRHITESIQYASRIQNAVLPPKKIIDEVFPENFILFKPRDIVSGDYYWMTKIKPPVDNEDGSKDKLVLAVADCTGHGVPGAFMSMLGVSLLNEIVIKNETLNANEILRKLRENIKLSLRQTGKSNEAKDGMDMALCIFDFETNKLQYAGAYNPLYIMRNNELIHFKGDRMPVGIHIKEKYTFTNHITDIIKDDVYYLFSDGYVDQPGGKLNKKFLSKNFRKMLIKNHKKPMQVQKQILEETLNEWQGKWEQIDDILVMGIKA